MSEHPILRISPPPHYVEIDGDSLFLGRDCHLASFIAPLAGKVVSNRHCVIRREGERWMLEDLGSTNGTWMRGTRVFGKVLLHNDDSFTLGKLGPICDCYSGFGGTGPDATIAEDDRARLEESAKTVMEPARTVAPDGNDGSAEKPYKVGRTPEVLLRHERTKQEFRAKGYTIVIGRDPEAQIVVRTDEERHISGRHVELQFRTDGSVVARDLGSRNGSWVNDRPLKGEIAIKMGDRLVLGSAATTLRVVQLDSF